VRQPAEELYDNQPYRIDPTLVESNPGGLFYGTVATSQYVGESNIPGNISIARYHVNRADAHINTATGHSPMQSRQTGAPGDFRERIGRVACDIEIYQ
jgi:hypothetical protein